MVIVNGAPRRVHLNQIGIDKSQVKMLKNVSRAIEMLHQALLE